MKRNCMYLWPDLLFFLFNLLWSIYYLLADYGKAISGWGGLGWFFLSLALLTAVLVPLPRVFIAVCFLVALLQVPIITCYVFWGYARSSIFGIPFAFGYWGILIHFGILLLAVLMAVLHIRRLRRLHRAER